MNKKNLKKYPDETALKDYDLAKGKKMTLEGLESEFTEKRTLLKRGNLQESTDIEDRVKQPEKKILKRA